MDKYKKQETNGDKMKNCELNESKVCNDCGECEICDVDKNKICDNCCICIGLDSDYKVVEIENMDDGIDYDFTEEEEKLFTDWASKKRNDIN